MYKRQVQEREEKRRDVRDMREWISEQRDEISDKIEDLRGEREWVGDVGGYIRWKREERSDKR